MSDRTYNPDAVRPLVWLHGEVKTPPFSREGRIVVVVQRDAIVVLEVFAKRTRAIPHEVLATCRTRLARYLQAAEGRAQR
jgi:hypothetical protein